MEFEAVIGLELHIEMKTVSKMFSCAPVCFGGQPNTEVDLLDMAFPGAMPTVNKQAVINAIRVANALHMEIDDTVIFERKNYFYSDLPKGYQLTQEFRPLGKNGYLIIETSNGSKKIAIERLHIEEDTCKQIHYSDYSLLDYNRAGIPLIEVVSYPEITSGEEAAKYVEKIRSIVSFLDVSDGKMEEGSLRCDVNVSLKRKGTKTFGTKVEIKNLNSFSNIQKAIDYEIERQSSILSSGGIVQQETRRFDENDKKTVLMRIKTDAIDYKCFTDPNIVPIKLSKDFIEEAINTSNELPDDKLKRYQSLGLNKYDCSLLLINKETSEYYDRVVKRGANPKLAANWIITDVQGYLNKNGPDISEFNVSPNYLSELISLLEKDKVNSKQAREIFLKMIETNENPNKLVNKLGFSQINNARELLVIVNELLDHYPSLVSDYKEGKKRVLSFFVGEIMIKTQGKANPNLATELLIQEIKRR